MMLWKISSSRTTRVQYSWKRTVKHQAVREQSISAFAIFFVTDRINKGDVSVAWCPTDDMTGDFFTKPNQGALFRRFRDLIMEVLAQPDPGPGKYKK